MIVTPDTLKSFPAIVRRNTWQQSEPMFIDVNRWSYEEIERPRVSRGAGDEARRS